LPTEHGPRRDTALFAHLAGVPSETPGHIVTNRLARGWCWRIPLPGRMSVGLVLPGEELARFGATIEEQYDACIRTDPWIRAWGAGAERLTPVVKYSNYQLVTLRGVGDGWALLGDAFGFVDPVFSSGLLLAMDGARALADAILAGAPAAFMRYERHVIRHIRAWQRAVGFYYDGRLFTLMRIGERNAHTAIGRLIQPHLNTHLPRVFTGEATTRRYSFGLLSAMCRHALGADDPSRLAIR
jgi:flavin-dependent dehydrogenase